MKLCRCGCGQPVPSLSEARQRFGYIPGHQIKGKLLPSRRLPAPNEIPSGRCECGCGQPTEPAPETIPRLRWFRGFQRPYVQGHAKLVPRGKRTIGSFSVEEAAYVAGIIDGEGCLQLRQRSVRITVGNTSPELIDWLHRFGGFVTGYANPAGRKPSLVWSVSNRWDCIAVLEATIPYLVIKKARAEEILILLRSWLPERRDQDPSSSSTTTSM